MSTADDSNPKLTAEAMRCLDCDYDLRGLDVDRCPECGRSFEPNDPLSYRSRQYIRVRLDTHTKHLTTCWLIAFVAGCLVVAIDDNHLTAPFGTTALCMLIFVGCLLGTYIQVIRAAVLTRRLWYGMMVLGLAIACTPLLLIGPLLAMGMVRADAIDVIPLKDA